MSDDRRQKGKGGRRNGEKTDGGKIKKEYECEVRER
jgi:hypothetical protein